MFIGIAIVLVLISMGGLIAFLGDRIGSVSYTHLILS